MQPDPEILRRLDPALHAFATARSDLSLGELAAVRDSLNQRRREAVGQIDATGIEVTDTIVPRGGAASVPVRIYRARRRRRQR